MHLNSEKIKQLRLDKGWTQQQLADACGVSMRTVQRVEKLGIASVDTTAALCAVFQLERRQLLRLSTEAYAVRINTLPVVIISSSLGMLTGIILTWVIMSLMP